MLNEYPDVLTVQDIQKIFRVGKNRAYDLVKTKAIPSIRIGGTYRISKDAVKSVLCYNNTHADDGLCLEPGAGR